MSNVISMPKGEVATIDPAIIESIVTKGDLSGLNQVQTDDPSMQEIEVFECYVKTDIDGKGIASLVQVFYASNEILEDEKGKEMVEEVDYVPFHSICPIPIPHKFFGNSLADRTVDLQLIKTPSETRARSPRPIPH